MVVVVVGADLTVDDVPWVDLVVTDVEGTVVVDAVTGNFVVEAVDVVVDTRVVVTTVVLVALAVVDVEVLEDCIVDVVPFNPPIAGRTGDPKIGTPALLVVDIELAPGFVVLVVVAEITVVLGVSL